MKKNTLLKSILAFSLLIIIFAACGSEVDSTPPEQVNSPVLPQVPVSTSQDSLSPQVESPRALNNEPILRAPILANESLDLSGRALTEENLRAFFSEAGSHPHIRRLTLARARFDHAHLVLLPITLEELDLSAIHLMDADIPLLHILRNLRTLDLSSNWIGPAGAASIATLRGITNLNLNNNQIAEAGAASIATMRGITTLSLRANWIGVAGAASISTMTGITNLNLSHNQIGNEGAARLAIMISIINFDLRDNNQIGMETQAWLRQQMPQTVLAF